jgi:ribonuclease E
MEMSRQRLRTGVLEASTRPCPHCEGTGLVRTASSAGLSALRLIEEEAARGKGSRITLRASQEATFYLLNEKRRELREIEELYGVTVEILPDGETEGARMAVEVSGPPPIARRSFAPIAPIEDDDDDDYPEDEEEAEAEAAEERPARSRDREEGAREREEGEVDGDGRKRRRRRRRGRRGRRDENGNEIPENAEDREADGDASDGNAADQGESEEAPADVENEVVEAEETEAKPRRRRGGRGRKKAETVETGDEDATEADAAPVEVADAAEPVAEEAPTAEEKPKRKRAPRKAKAATEAQAGEPVAEAVEAVSVAEAVIETAPEAEPEAAKPAPKKRASRAKKAVAAEAAPEAATTRDAEPAANGDEDGVGPDGEPRRGWWQRTFGN